VLGLGLDHGSGRFRSRLAENLQTLSAPQGSFVIDVPLLGEEVEGDDGDESGDDKKANSEPPIAQLELQGGFHAGLEFGLAVENPVRETPVGFDGRGHIVPDDADGDEEKSGGPD
jgi:hypothetical protein